jgi:hypothetical protein
MRISGYLPPGRGAKEIGQIKSGIGHNYQTGLAG